MKRFLLSTSFALLLLASSVAQSTNTFEWPETPASELYQDFLKAYNSNNLTSMTGFVEKYYPHPTQDAINSSVEYWSDIYHRYGPMEAHKFSINKPYDMEVWLKGSISKNWIAPQFVLSKDTDTIIAAGLLQGTSPSGSETPSKNIADLKLRMSTYLDEMEAANLFQGNVLLKQGKNALIKKSYGFKDVDLKERNQLSTRMRISSITKMITAVATLQLVQKGQLKLHTPISEYLPDYPAHIADEVTIHDLLTHTSAIELDGIDGFRSAHSEANTFEDRYQIHLEYLPKWEYYNNFENTGKYDYSNDDFDLLATIVEKTSVLDYREYIKQNIFDVAGMKHTSYYKTRVATPYRYDIATKGLRSYESSYGEKEFSLSGAGSLISTVADLENFHRSLFHTYDLLSLPYRSIMISPLVYRGGGEYYGYGTSMHPTSPVYIGHNGTNIGNSAEFRYFPEYELTLVVLANNRSGAHNVFSFLKTNLPNQ